MSGGSSPPPETLSWRVGRICLLHEGMGFLDLELDRAQGLSCRAVLLAHTQHFPCAALADVVLR